MSYHIPDYWDLCTGPNDPGFRIDWCGADGTSEAYDIMSWSPQYGGTTKLDNYFKQNGSQTPSWGASWFLRVDPTAGLVECADWLPKSGIEKTLLFWSSLKKSVYDQGIDWGGDVDVPSSQTTPIVIDFFKSAMLPGPLTQQQRVDYEKHFDIWKDPMGRVHKDVIRLQFYQTWNGKCSGGYWWLAKGIGRVGARWRTYDPLTFAVLTDTKTASAVYSDKREVATS